ncbi:hypothetical protein ABZX12_39355 [Kribbella sp. NPDC003505]|uniref:tetratricopeptide repeat protein n=1 Tax=Kribbella sp. NPDC003505 TaxID=3154448 RepID=UPI0033ADFEB5
MRTDLEQAALTATELAVRRDPAAADAVENCREALAERVPDAQRIAFLIGWAYLALDDPASAWEAFRAAASSDRTVASDPDAEPSVLGRAALLAGLISFRFGPEVYGLAAWSRAHTEVTAVLGELDFTRDLAGQLTDDLIWPDNEELRSGDPVLAPLLSDFDAAHRSRAALGLYTLHLMRDEEEAAARAARQVVAIGQPDFVGAAWLGLAEVLVAAGDKAAAAEACERSAATVPGGRPVSAILGVEDDSTADVPTRAKTLLGILQREAGDDDLAVRTLTDAACGDDPEAVFALAQTHQKTGDFDAARAVYLTIADRKSPVLDKTIYHLGLIAKHHRDLPEAKRWFGQFVESGYDGAPLAAAHLGELCYWLGDKAGALHWYGYTLANTEVPELVEEAEQRTAELTG